MFFVANITETYIDYKVWVYHIKKGIGGGVNFHDAKKSEMPLQNTPNNSEMPNFFIFNIPNRGVDYSTKRCTGFGIFGIFGIFWDLGFFGIFGISWDFLDFLGDFL